MARVEFSPDGKRWQVVRKGSTGKMWDYFTQSRDIRQNLMLMPPDTRFRLIGEEDKVIGVLAYDRQKREFKHLSGVI